jgi:hypothetical protein
VDCRLEGGGRVKAYRVVLPRAAFRVWCVGWELPPPPPPHPPSPLPHPPHTRARPHSIFSQLLDVDVVFDNSDVFPRGFVQLFSELEAQLWSELTRPVGLCAGSAHCAVLTEAGHVYTWGWGDRGQCGHGVLAGERRPRIVDALLHEAGSGIARGPSNPLRIKQLVAGEEHTVALSEGGTAYAWGCGRRGQLGLGDKEPRCVPTPLDTLARKVAQVAAGAFHTLLLLTAGTMYACGSGKQLGLGVYTGSGDTAVPTLVAHLAKRRMRAVASGAVFSMAVSNEGEVFAWGIGRDGQLGLGDRRDRLVPTLVSSLNLESADGRVVMVRVCGQRCCSSRPGLGGPLLSTTPTPPPPTPVRPSLLCAIPLPRRACGAVLGNQAVAV